MVIYTFSLQCTYDAAVVVIAVLSSDANVSEWHCELIAMAACDCLYSR
jgi:hypothetical protein